MSRIFSYVPRAGSSPLSRWRVAIDWPLIFLIICLAVLGLYAVNLTSAAASSRIELGHTHFILKQLKWVPLGLMVILVLSFATQRQVRLLGFLISLGAIALMVVVMAAGQEIKGATRWIRILGISIQPSEFLKPGLAVVVGAGLAVWRQHQSRSPILIAFGLTALAVGLLVLQPDIGQTVLVTAMVCTQIFISGEPLKRLIAVAGSLVVAGSLALTLLPLDHVQERLTSFMSDRSDPTSQISKSLDSIAAGGVFGEGPGNGDFKYQLADSHTDFILSVVAEEHGIFGCLILLLLYLVIAVRTLARLRDQSNLFVHVAGVGLLFQLIAQAWINMASTVGLIPTKGMTLPLVSYGGSSVLSVCITFGLLVALTRKYEDIGNWQFRGRPALASALHMQTLATSSETQDLNTEQNTETGAKTDGGQAKS